MVEPEGRKAPVMDQIQNNAEEVNLLHENVKKLEKRLNMVLVNEPPQTDSEGKSPEESASPIKRMLDEQLKTLRRTNDQVRRIMTRLEI